LRAIPAALSVAGSEMLVSMTTYGMDRSVRRVPDGSGDYSLSAIAARTCSSVTSAKRSSNSARAPPRS
jgi:hypothetical protein